MKSAIIELPPQIPATARLADKVFFGEHKDRRLRIRVPFEGEYVTEFRGFGMHNEGRRRVIVARMPASMARRHNVDIMRIPFLSFADETIADEDAVLAPILDRIMRDAAGVG